jgi:hypothetical protein
MGPQLPPQQPPQQEVRDPSRTTERVRALSAIIYPYFNIIIKDGPLGPPFGHPSSSKDHMVEDIQVLGSKVLEGMVV